MKEAEQIRRERNSKRARERAAAQAEAEAKLTALHPSHPSHPSHPAHPLKTGAGGVGGGAGTVDPSQPAAAATTVLDEERVPLTTTKAEDDKVLVGNLIGEDHVNYVLMYNMLTGIRIGVSWFYFCL